MSEIMFERKSLATPEEAKNGRFTQEAYELMTEDYRCPVCLGRLTPEADKESKKYSDNVKVIMNVNREIPALGCRNCDRLYNFIQPLAVHFEPDF